MVLKALSQKLVVDHEEKLVVDHKEKLVVDREEKLVVDHQEKLVVNRDEKLVVDPEKRSSRGQKSQRKSPAPPRRMAKKHLPQRVKTDPSRSKSLRRIV